MGTQWQHNPPFFSSLFANYIVNPSRKHCLKRLLVSYLGLGNRVPVEDNITQI